MYVPLGFSSLCIWSCWAQAPVRPSMVSGGNRLSMDRAKGGSQAAGKDARKDLPGASVSEIAQVFGALRLIYMDQVGGRGMNKGGKALNLHMQT